MGFSSAKIMDAVNLEIFETGTPFRSSNSLLSALLSIETTHGLDITGCKNEHGSGGLESTQRSELRTKYKTTKNATAKGALKNRTTSKYLMYIDIIGLPNSLQPHTGLKCYFTDAFLIL